MTPVTQRSLSVELAAKPVSVGFTLTDLGTKGGESPAVVRALFPMTLVEANEAGR